MFANHSLEKKKDSKDYGLIPQVVINADDLGLHPAVNEGILQAHKEGVVTSTSLIPCGVAFEDAVEHLRTSPDLGVGVHLTLVEEKPLLPARNILSLIDCHGFFPKSYREFTGAYIQGKIRKRDLQAELEAQIERVLEKGIRPSHLDSHQHIHSLPGIWQMTMALARRYGISFLRIPTFDRILCGGKPARWVIRAGMNTVARIRRTLCPRLIQFCDHIKGLSSAGDMTVSRLLMNLDAVQRGLIEIIVHPGLEDVDLLRRYGGWKYNWATELKALIDPVVRSRCQRGDFLLTNFGDIRKLAMGAHGTCRIHAVL